ncbi:MAG: hypothetical protein C0402_05295 [Thermodesulfovibrio sp.]|nr:hypothetical protein [Thermodesulfovibrio sp.]
MKTGGHVTGSPEEIFRRTHAIKTRQKGCRALSYGVVGRKNNHLYVYQITVEKQSAEGENFRLAVVEVDLATAASTLREDLAFYSAEKGVVQRRVGELKKEYTEDTTHCHPSPQPAV